jgi:pSer/pThr/pTyr-binding forkhead associated (FHA) protein
MAKLVVLTEGFTGTSFELKGERTTVGRMEDNAFQIAEPSVSSHHCEIIARGAEVVVKDLNSTNGTFINGQRTSEGVLRPGQVLRLGSVEVRLDDGTPPPAPTRRQQDHTQLLPGGVKLTELEQGSRPVGSPFAKKSAGMNKVFLYVGIGLAVVIIGSLVYVVLTLGR